MFTSPSHIHISMFTWSCQIWLPDARKIAYLSHSLHDAKFLCRNEALQHDAYRHVDIVFIDVVTKMHSSVTFRHANHRLNVPYRDWYASSCLNRTADSTARAQCRTLKIQLSARTKIRSKLAQSLKMLLNRSTCSIHDSLA